MTVDALLENMSSAEFGEWQAYYSLDPFGSETTLQDCHFAQLESMYAESHRDKEKRSKPYSPEDFRLIGKKTEQEKPQSWGQIKTLLTLFGKAFQRRKKKT